MNSDLIDPEQNLSPLIYNAWDVLMKASKYSDKHPAYYKLILEGIKHGVEIDYIGNRMKNRRCNNLPISDVDESKVHAVILADVAAGIKAGPFDQPPFEHFSCSPIGCVPKRTPGEIRVIHHLSHPRSGDQDSINAHTLDTKTTLGSFDRATELVKQLGKGCWLIKIDVKAAYKLIRVRKADQPLLGFTWRNKYYYERVLPFGLRSSCRLWEWYATALHHIIEHHAGISRIVHYIDDFLFVLKYEEQAKKKLQTALSICDKLGVPIAGDKTEGPVNKLTFLGIEINTIDMTASLSEDRLLILQTLLSDWELKTAATVAELMSVEGVLQWCTKVVRPGRAFLERIREFKNRVKKFGEGPHKLDQEVIRDIRWWRNFASDWNGVSLLYDEQWTDAKVINLYTDACEDGFGCTLGNQWFCGRWTQDQINRAHNPNPSNLPGVKERSMPFYELLALVLAASTWGHQWKGMKIVFYTDCMPVMHAVDSLRSKSVRMMGPIRYLATLAAQHQFDYKCDWIAGKKNVLADALSRFDLDKFRENLPTAHIHPTPVIPLPPFDEM